ncbi:MAG TPA: YaaR family protein [Rectinemataceae bacterium]|nr:YaaR family protein [Rectinemataceae bacterium]
MASIEFPDGLNPFLPSLLPRRPDEDSKTKTKKSKGIFGSLLGRAVGETGREARSGSIAGEPYSADALEKLMDLVHEAGDRLKENPTVDLVQGYKRAVRDFVHYVVEHSYALERKESRRKLDQRIYFRIAVVDDSLEKLGAEILRNQRDKLEILRRVDEINGMLVDLFR